MKQEKVRKRDLLSILAVALVAFAGILSETSMNVTFPHLSQVFGLSLGVLQWITTGYLLSSYQSGASHRSDLRRLHDWLLRLAHDL